MTTTDTPVTPEPAHQSIAWVTPDNFTYFKGIRVNGGWVCAFNDPSDTPTPTVLFLQDPDVAENNGVKLVYGDVAGVSTEPGEHA